MIQTDEKLLCDYCGFMGLFNVRQALTGFGKFTDPWAECPECGEEYPTQTKESDT